MPLFLHDHDAGSAEGHAHLLGHLIGIEWKDSHHIQAILNDPKQLRNRALHAAAQMFRRISASDGSPVVLELEDLHWADGETLDFLNYLAEVNRDVPLLVLAFTRPTLFEQRKHWRSPEGIHQRIDLTPLDKRASRDLANELLKKLPVIPAMLRELLTSSAEGNPFYMEELVKMLIDQSAIQTGETWAVNAERLLVTKVPPTLTGVLQARLDGLPAPERLALQQASIVGAVFWDKALAAIAAQAAEQLPALVQRELTLPRTDAVLDGLSEFAFRHQVLHQVTYNTVLKRAKREGHFRVATWLAGLIEQGSLRAGDLLGLAAEHFEQAGDGPHAAEFHARAAEQAGERLIHGRVLEHVDRALALLDAADSKGASITPSTTLSAHAALRWRMLMVRERTFALQARRDEQAADIDTLEQLAAADDRRLAQVARLRCIRAMCLADWAAMESAARHCMDCAMRANDHCMRLLALRLLAAAKVRQGEIDVGRALAQQGLAEARRVGYRWVEAAMLNTLSGAAEMQGDIVSGLDLNRQSLEIMREIGDRVGEALDLSRLGDSWLMLGDLAQAQRDLDASLLLLRDNGDRVMVGGALESLSTLARWQGNGTRALELARQALDIATSAQARDKEVSAGFCLGEAEVALGRTVAARQTYAQARARAL